MLNLLDYIIILFLLWKGWQGMKNGLIIELGGLIILYISFIISTGNNFITDLSIIDLISNLGEQSLDLIKKSRENI